MSSYCHTGHSWSTTRGWKAALSYLISRETVLGSVKNVAGFLQPLGKLRRPAVPADVCDRRLPWKLLPRRTPARGRADARRYGRSVVLLSGDPHLHTSTGHAEAPDHAHSRHLPGPGLRDRWSDQRIQRRRPLPAGGGGISWNTGHDEQTCLTSIMSQEQRVTFIYLF